MSQPPTGFAARCAQVAAVVAGLLGTGAVLALFAVGLFYAPVRSLMALLDGHLLVAYAWMGYFLLCLCRLAA